MSKSTKKILWCLVALVVLLALGGRAWQSRQTQGAAESQARTPAPLQLGAVDVSRAERGVLAHTLDLSGGLKAVNMAVVKAKVAAELQQLSVREGDAVRAGQLLGVLDPTESELRLRQARENAQAAQAQAEISKRNLDNSRALVAQGFVSPTALETAQSNDAAARANLQAMSAAQALAQKSLNDTRLLAPISGVVSQRLAQPGERVAVDGRVLEIVDLSALELEATLAPEQAAALRVGAAAELEVEGLPAKVQGKVVRINPAAQAGSRAVLAYVRVAGQPGLRHGAFARGTVVLDSREALLVGREDVRVDRARPYVLVIDQGKLLAREVVLGQQGQARVGSRTRQVVEVLSGLRGGELVLSGAAGQVAEGTAVALPGADAASAASAASR
ncbi:efflux RND transporter periplasmic adaptor subunit [Roseateles sp. BYS180W]|uniref:Efflux RND transporter periplasmic adaptor subunit n=1 Tax=Roseateles rivi TaxID=3299028 RepID=A0ABW7FV56_9BURK